MNTRTKLIALLLAAAMMLSLTACSGSTDTQPDATPEASDSTPVPETSDTTSDSVLPDDFEPDLDVEDLCLATAGIPGDFELLTINGQPVSAQMYLYWLAFSISEMESAMYSYYGMPLDWSEEFGLGEYLMADALNATLMYTLIPGKAKELGYDLTDDQVAEFDAYTAQTIEAMGGEEGFNESLRMLGLDRETYLDINRTSYYYQQILNGMFDGRPTDSDMVSYIEEKGLLRAQHILLAFPKNEDGSAVTDEQKAQTKAKADDILAQIRAADDPAAKFDELMHEHSGDGRNAAGELYKPEGYTFLENGSLAYEDGGLVTEFVTASLSLAEGEVSEPVETTYGYHILLRQPVDTDTEEARKACLTALASNQINTWISEADIVFTDEYDNLDPQLFYEKFMSYQAVFSAARSAS